MYRRVTTLLALIVMLVGTSEALAQTEVTIREINDIPQAGIDAVSNLGIDLTEQDIIDNIRSPLTGESVTFTAVVLSAPQNSGLSSYNESRNGPSRVHYFVRDTSAVSLGNDGMIIQVVDGNWDTSGTIDLLKGDVVTMTGEVAYFGTGLQFSPETIEYQGTYQSLGLPDTIMDPVTVTIDQLNKFVGDSNEQSQANWDNFIAMNQQFVRIENVEVFQSPNRFDDRPSFVLRDKTTGQVIQNDDLSARYRNDRTQYPDPPFNTLDDDFVAPPAGATVNIEGFALLRTDFDAGDNFTPDEGFISISPWEDDDLEITASPPLLTHNRPSGVPSGAGDYVVTLEAEPDPARTITSTSVFYTTTTNATETEVNGVNTDGNTYSFTIPSADLNDGDFVSYRFEATDSENATSETGSFPLRVLDAGITSFAHIQETQDGGPGGSPFADMQVDMNITATVQQGPETGLMSLQDDASAAGWSGMFIENAEDNTELNALSPGDVINITNARVYERFDVTNLDNQIITFTTTSTGGDPIAAKLVTTDILQDGSVAEAHEGIMLEIDDPYISTGDAGFGEFAISSDGTTDNELRVDDKSDTFPSDGYTNFVEGTQIDFAVAPLWYSFGDYKLAPANLDSFGPVIDTATEDLVQPASFTLNQNYPNPFNPSTKIEFDVTSAGAATLEVFDILGRKVRTLIDGNVSVGTQTVTFNAGGLPSGLYIYRLSAGENVQTRKMLLLK